MSALRSEKFLLDFECSIFGSGNDPTASRLSNNSLVRSYRHLGCPGNIAFYQNDGGTARAGSSLQLSNGFHGYL